MIGITSGETSRMNFFASAPSRMWLTVYLDTTTHLRRTSTVLGLIER